MPSLSVYAIVVLIAVLVWAFLSFDNLIRMEYEEYHRQWIHDKKPVGFFWRPENSARLASTGKHNFMLSWLFKTPEWARSNQQALQLLTRFRLLVLTWNLGLLLWFLLSVNFRLL